GVGVVRVLAHHGAQAVQHLDDGLVELGLPGVALQDLLIERLQCRIKLVHAGQLPFARGTEGSEYTGPRILMHSRVQSASLSTPQADGSSCNQPARSTSTAISTRLLRPSRVRIAPRWLLTVASLTNR